MLSPAALLRALTEVVFVLLGGFLIQVALSGRFAARFLSDRRSAIWIGLGVFLIYWGLRAWQQASRTDTRPQFAAAVIRGGSLLLVGVMMLGIAWLPIPWITPLLVAAGGILVLRGLVSAVLVMRTP